MIFPVVIFYLLLVAIFALLISVGVEIKPIYQVAIFGLPTFIAIYPKIKREGRLLNLSEKVLFTLFTWGVYSLVTIMMIFYGLDKEPTTPVLIIGAFNYFLAFCGVWLVISTNAERFFRNVIKNA